MSKQNECERCLNSRVICSENGFHSICTLSPEKIAKCFIGKENHFKEEAEAKLKEREGNG